jgi:hypothetical protein
MKSRYIFISTAILLIFAVGCETTEKIDEFPLRPSKLVVNSYFTADSAWAVQVSKSLSVLDNADIKFINDASITIYENDVWLDTLNASDGGGWYYSDRTRPSAGKKYSIEVTTPKFENTVTAEEILPEAVPITDVKISIIDSSFYRNSWIEGNGKLVEEINGNVEGTIDITFSDPAGINNYYQISAFSYYTYIDYIFDPENPETMDSIIYYNKEEVRFSTDDPVADNADNYISKLYFSDDIIDGQDYQLKLEFDTWINSYDKEYYVELISMNKAGYLYRKSVKEYLNSSGDPFSEPVLIYSNIENGFGIFAGYSTVYDSVMLFE